LADLLTAHVFEVEDIEEFEDDTVFEFKILPDRAHYLLSHKGVAREISTITGLPMKTVAQIDQKDVPQKEKTKIDVLIKDDLHCRRYIAQEITNIEVKASPEWLKKRLGAVGQKSINNIVDAANYVMLDIGQPLHAFDADKIIGNLVVRSATDSEKIILLTGQEVILSKDNLVIADDAGPLAVAGVKGGKRAEVNELTTRIIIESANFDPTSIRKTSTKLNLRNDASKRFENEITPALARDGIEKITKIITDLLPSARPCLEKDLYSNPVKEWEIVVSPKNIEVLIGTTVGESVIEETLLRMGCQINKKEGLFYVIPPLDRFDLTIPEDIADEVGRILGYEKLPSKLPPDLEGELLPDKMFFYAEKIKNVLIQQGYSEALLYSLVAKGDYEVIYPLASDKSFLRADLSSKLEESLVVNGRNADLISLETIKMFEIGKVFRKDGEKTTLAIGVLQVKKKKGVSSEKILKEDLEVLESSLGTTLDYELRLGEFGAITEINFDELVSQLPQQKDIPTLDFKSLPNDKKYQKFSLYPFITRDIAIFVPEKVTEEEVFELIRENVGSLCVKSWLFDVFTKETPGGNKKSFAFRLVFQSPDKTLVDKEINEIMDNIYKEIKLKIDWQIR
jgi:phenylalanyl-tRNA synthetase beta chain